MKLCLEKRNVPYNEESANVHNLLQAQMVLFCIYYSIMYVYCVQPSIVLVFVRFGTRKQLRKKLKNTK